MTVETLHNPQGFYQLSIFFSHYDKMNQSTLMCLCGAHGLSSLGTVSELCNRLFNHVCGGHCKDSGVPDSDGPPSCENTISELPNNDASDLATYVLAATVHKMILKTLRRVVEMYKLECSSADSASKL